MTDRFAYAHRWTLWVILGAGNHVPTMECITDIDILPASNKEHHHCLRDAPSQQMIQDKMKTFPFTPITSIIKPWQVIQWKWNCISDTDSGLAAGGSYTQPCCTSTARPACEKKGQEPGCWQWAMHVWMPRCFPWPLLFLTLLLSLMQWKPTWETDTLLPMWLMPSQFLCRIKISTNMNSHEMAYGMLSLYFCIETLIPQ